MRDSFCGQLEDYLDGELLQPERRRFESHLPSCPSCNEEIAAFARLKRRLASAVEQELCPPELIRRIESQILTAPERRPIRISARIAVAAATLCVAAWLTLGLRKPQPTELWVAPDAIPRPELRSKPSEAPASHGNKSTANIRVELSDEYLAVPVETNDPRIAIIWLYPTAEVSTPADLPDPANPRSEL